MMTRDFEPITEKEIHQDEFGEGERCTEMKLFKLMSLVCCKHVESKEMELSTYWASGDILDCNAAGQLKGNANVLLVSMNSSKFPVLEDFSVLRKFSSGF